MLGRDPRDAWCWRGWRSAMRCRSCRINTRYFALSANHSDVPGFDAGSVAGERRPGDRFRSRCAVAPEQGCSRRPARALCRSARIRLHARSADAQFPVRPDDHRDVLVRAGGFGTGAARPHRCAMWTSGARGSRERSTDAARPWRAEAERAGTRQHESPCLAESLSARDRRSRHHRDQRIFVPPGILSAGHAGQPVRGQLGGRTGLGFSAHLSAPSWHRRTAMVVSVLG